MPAVSAVEWDSRVGAGPPLLLTEMVGSQILLCEMPHDIDENSIALYCKQHPMGRVPRNAVIQ